MSDNNQQLLKDMNFIDDDEEIDKLIKKQKS
jgi:hypothetical protein